jgi:Zn-dependent peptidase ImmA (M78 family)
MQEAPRMYAARLSARMLLKRIWAASTSADVHQILIEAPKRAAEQFGVATTFAAAIHGDNKIAGVFDRLGKRIVIANCFSLVSQRFTFAHELGHMMLHPGQIYFYC